MKRPTFLTWEQLRVGAVILIGLTVLAVAVIRLGDSISLFSERYRLVAFVPNANGIRVGGGVQIAGQLAGTIAAIEFLPPDNDTTRNLRVVLEIDERLQAQVREDSRARLRPLGLLGDKVIDISPGTPQFAVLTAGDTLPVGESVDYDEVLLQASAAVDEVVALTRDLRVITGSIVEGEGTIGQLLTSRAIYDDVRTTLDQANGLLATMQNPNGSFGRLLNDPTLYRNLTSLTGSVDSLVLQINRPDGTLGRLIRDDTLYTRLVDVVATADSVLEMVVGGDGTVGQLLRDPKLYNDLTQAVTELTLVLRDLRINPRKYTPGLIRIF